MDNGVLTLTRRIGEKLILTTASGERIEVWPVESTRGQVKMATRADKSVRVVREEIEHLPDGRAS